jgi:hypothetical protein
MEASVYTVHLPISSVPSFKSTLRTRLLRLPVDAWLFAQRSISWLLVWIMADPYEPAVLSSILGNTSTPEPVLPKPILVTTDDSALNAERFRSQADLRLSSQDAVSVSNRAFWYRLYNTP